VIFLFFFFFSSRRRHTRWPRDWSSDVCSSDLRNRAAGRPEVMFVMERLIDIAARQFGFDRIELRRRNLVPQNEMPYTNPFGMVYDSGAYHDVMEKALVLADWKGFPKRNAAARKLGRYRGIGIANYVDTATGIP